MSYWDEIEKVPGIYDFAELDRQIKQISKAGGVVTLCLGARQPRWAENHWAEWAWKLPKLERTEALFKYIEAVVTRYSGESCLVSYQLENEALNRGFGERGDFERKRLRYEFRLVKRLDPRRAVIMTTSNSWGLPLRRPVPDIIGFSLYRTMYLHGKQTTSKLPIWSYRLRGWTAKLLLRRQSFIHELQAEPWGPQAIWEMTLEEQNDSMGPEQLAKNIALAKQTKLYPIDLWGGEWWYWRATKHKDLSVWEAVEESISSTQ